MFLLYAFYCLRINPTRWFQKLILNFFPANRTLKCSYKPQNSVRTEDKGRSNTHDQILNYKTKD